MINTPRTSRAFEHASEYMREDGEAAFLDRVNNFKITEHQKELIRSSVDGYYSNADLCILALENIALAEFKKRYEHEARTVRLLRSIGSNGILADYFDLAGDGARIGDYIVWFDELTSKFDLNELAGNDDSGFKGPSLELGSVLTLGDISYQQGVMEPLGGAIDALQTRGYEVGRRGVDGQDVLKSTINKISKPNGKIDEKMLHLIVERGVGDLQRVGGQLIHVVDRSHGLVLVDKLPVPVKNGVNSALKNSSDKSSINAERLSSALSGLDGIMRFHQDEYAGEQHGPLPAYTTVYIRAPRHLNDRS